MPDCVWAQPNLFYLFLVLLPTVVQCLDIPHGSLTGLANFDGLPKHLDNLARAATEDDPPDCEIGRPETALSVLLDGFDGTPALLRRAPVNPKPLENPGDDFEDFVNRQFLGPQTESVPIVPDEEEVQAWKIDVGRKSYAIGATGYYYPFGKVPQTFRMNYLTGCTAIFVVSPHGIWASHFWESESRPNIGGSFKKRTLIPGGTNTKVEERPKQEFEAVAVDILGQVTGQNRPQWVSIKDLETIRRYNNPFANGKDVEVLVWTKAKSDNKRSEMQYKEKIGQFQAKFQELIPESTWKVRTYVGEDRKIPDTRIRGLTGIQYTPYQQKCGDKVQARVRVYNELIPDPAIDMVWSADKSQGGTKKRDEACPAPAPNSSHTSTTHTSTMHTSATHTSATHTSTMHTPTSHTSTTHKTATTPHSHPTHSRSHHPPRGEVKYVAWVANRTVDIGDAEGTNRGADLGQNLYKELLKLCKNSTCSTSETVPMGNAGDVYNETPEDIHPEIFFEDAAYTDEKTLQEMLLAGLSLWLAAASRNCKDKKYTLENVPIGQCTNSGGSIHKRDAGPALLTESNFEKRMLGPPGDDPQSGQPCHYSLRACEAPELINVNGPDAENNHLNLRIDLASDKFGDLVCEVVIEGLTAVALTLAPELTTEVALEEKELKFLCGAIADLVEGGS